MIDRNTVNIKLSSVNKVSKVNSLNTVGDNAKIEREAIEGATIGLTVNQTSGGFVSLTASTNENKSITLEPTVALMTSTVPGITLTKTSTKSAEIAILTGRQVGNGFLNATVAHGSPRGIEKTLLTVTPATKAQVQSVVSQTSSNPTVAKELVEVDVSQKVSTSVETVSKKSNKVLAEPFGSTGVAITGAGTSFGNILANVVGTITGSIKKGTTQSIGTEIPATTAASTAIKKIDASGNSTNLLTAISKIGQDLSKSLGVPINVPAGAAGVAGSTGVFTSDGKSLNISEELPSIITDRGDTNVSKIIESDNLIGDVKPTTPVSKIGSEKNKWQGNFTPEEYEFTYVMSLEEWELELRNISRDVTTALVTWTDTCKNNDTDSKIMHDLHKKISEKFLKTESDLREKGGAQFHYIIQRDGTVQRGRPLESMSMSAFSNHGIVITFAAGINGNYPGWNFENSRNAPHIRTAESITRQQWVQFEAFLMLWYKVYPGGQVLGFNETGTGISPGFIPSEWAFDKFGKPSAYTGNDDAKKRRENKKYAFSSYELNKKVPDMPVRPTKPPRDTAPAPAPKPEEVADPYTGISPPRTLDEKTKLQIEYDDLQTEISNNKNDMLLLFNELTKYPHGSNERENFTNRYKVLEEENKVKSKRAFELEKLLSDGFNRTEDTLVALNNAKALLANRQQKLIKIMLTAPPLDKLNKYIKDVADAEAEVKRLQKLYDESVIKDLQRAA